MAAETDNAYLRRCFDLFPGFSGDFDILLEKEVITKEAPGCYVWNYSKSSLAEYFARLDASDSNLKNVKWGPVERAFYLKGEKGGPYKKIQKGSLRHLRSNNGRIFKGGVSLDTKKIFDILIPDRKRRAEQEQNMRVFGEIKTLVAETDEKKTDDVTETLEKIRKLLP